MRWSTKRYVLAALTALYLLSGISTAIADDGRPNVLLIIGDDQAWTDFGCMGHDTIRTPHIDRLAAESALFQRGYVPDSLCRPSLATIVTGLYPHQHRITGNDPRHVVIPGVPTSQNPEYLRLEAEYEQHITRVPTLPRVLSEAGYLSFQSGKWWEADYSYGGFTHGMTHGDPARGGRHGDEGLTIGREGLQPIYDFWDDAGEEPWFVWYAPFLPHSPHNPPERLLERYLAEGKSLHVARYQAMCEWFDETCGELLATLDARGMGDDTLVLFVTDNGWIQDPDSPRYAPRSKRSPYDGGIRTPIMVRWRGMVEPAVYDDTLVSSIDLAPTVYAAAGVDPGVELPGVDLVEMAANGGNLGREAVYGAIFEHDVAEIDDPSQSLMYRWCIRDEWKLILPADASSPLELYQLADDPFEEVNLASQSGDLVSELSAELDAWWDGH